jgi:hypothetical protein
MHATILTQAARTGGSADHSRYLERVPHVINNRGQIVRLLIDVDPAQLVFATRP